MIVAIQTIVPFNTKLIRLCCAIMIAFLFCSQQSWAANQAVKKQNKIEEVIGYVNQYCGACHQVPPPNLMPKKDWSRVIKVMADMAAVKFGGEFISAEIIRDISAYYRGSSPSSLAQLPYFNKSSHSVAFNASDLGEKSAAPSVINIHSVDLGIGGSDEFLICDSERNQVSLLYRKNEQWQEKLIAEIEVPSHTEVVDYDQDGDKDIIIAALGYLPPSEQLAGKLFLLRQLTPGNFSKEILIEGVGRISDARPADIDNDGDLDIALAIFGGGVVGEVAWLENLGQGKHRKHTVIRTSGALNVSPVDLNADGKVDLVSIITQEHEAVIALINKGGGNFEQVLLTQAPHPMFGFTGMRVVDLDGDSDDDILLTNGDAHDLQMDPKPHHGVQWLENKGKLQFQFHDIDRFYGAVTAVAGDMDSDGDLDIVASSWNNYWQDEKRQSVIWYENDGKQNFVRHNIISRPQSIVTLELKDVTGNNRLDIIAGSLRMDLLIEQITDDANNEKPSLSDSTDLLKSRIILLENKTLNKNIQQ
jgi:hypothetical protein